MKTLRTNAGSSFVAVAITMLIFTIALGVVMNVTQFESRNTNRTIARTQAIAYGDGVLESLFDQWRSATINASNTTDKTDGLSTTALGTSLSLPSVTTLPPPEGASVANWSVTAVTPMMAPTTRADGRPVAETGTNSRLRTRLNYLARVTVNYRAAAQTDTVTVERTFVRAGRNLFDNFFFGTQSETEFHPGPDMYVNGTAYIGGNLYTANDSLHFLGDVTFLGAHYTAFRPNDPHASAPTIQNGGFGNNWDLNSPPRQGSEQKLIDTRRDQLDPNFLDDPTSNDTDSDGNSNNNGYHEIIEEANTAQTDPLQIDAGTNERIASNADYRIYVDAANNVTIYKGASTTALSTSSAEYVALKGTLTTNTALRDVRDGDNVRTVSVNVGQLKTAYDNRATTGVADTVGGNDGLVFYIADTSNGSPVTTKVVNSATGATTSVTSNRSRGVKLVNGAALPSAGLTIASPNAVYIQGDYNTGTTGTSKPLSNTTSTYTPPNDKPSPVVTGYNRVAAAVVGDAVNVLSNSWNDANSLLAQSSRPATATTMNTTIIAGNVPTTAASYSGGIENFVRFHENWSNQYFTTYGSFALLYASQQATRPWSAADYTPPNRRWFYDTNLLDTNPPGFRIARVYERGRWTIR